jgi:cell division protein FtsL
LRNKKARGKRPRKGLTLGFLMLILFILAGMGVFMVALHQGALTNDMSALKLEQKISEEKTRQKSLRMSLARLKSPGRVTREATDVIGLTEPSAVIYLKYTKDANGHIICQSNFEDTGRKPSAKTVQEENGQEQLSQDGRKQASVKTEISSNMTTR